MSYQYFWLIFPEKKETTLIGVLSVKSEFYTTAKGFTDFFVKYLPVLPHDISN